MPAIQAPQMSEFGLLFRLELNHMLQIHTIKKKSTLSCNVKCEANFKKFKKIDTVEKLT